MEEQDKVIGKILINFYEMMKALDKQENREEAEGKKAVCLIMAMNDIDEFFAKEIESIKR